METTYTVTEPEYVKLTSRDNDFTFDNGIMIVNRAGLEISSGCPENYRDIIKECIKHGWLKPVARVPVKEYMWGKLQEE